MFVSKKILIIDDDPIRAMPVQDSWHQIIIAHGFEQIKFWLNNKHWHPDFICLDHDMPLMNGGDVVRTFYLDLMFRAIRIWSKNPIASRSMYDYLQDVCIQNDVDFKVQLLPFNNYDFELNFFKNLQ